MTLDDLAAHCMGAIGLSRKAFWNSSYRDILYVTEGYKNKMHDLSREAWMQTRILAYYIVSPHVKPGTVGSIESFMPFPWEQRAQVKRLTEKEEKAIRERLMLNVKLFDEQNRQKEWREENRVHTKKTH